MSRLFTNLALAFALIVIPMSIGCDSGSNQVIEQDTTAAELDQEEEDYEKLMEESESENNDAVKD